MYSVYELIFPSVVFSVVYHRYTKVDISPGSADMTIYLFYHQVFQYYSNTPDKKYELKNIPTILILIFSDLISLKPLIF